MNSITLTLLRHSPPNLIDMTGKTYGYFVVIARAGRAAKGQAIWECRCACGKHVVLNGQKIRSGHNTSCGCMRGKANLKHGMKGTPTYNTWCAMKQRCNYPACDSYEFYGARGVTVCKQWDESFEAFLADMGERPAGMTIDRFPNKDGNYEPGNCRWATEHDQARNRSSTILVDRNGVTKCVRDWCDELGLDVDRVYGRIRRGTAPAEALL
jgi:hypothetical protein